MKVRLDAGDVVFLHKKAQVSDIDFKHSCVCNDPQEGGKLGVVHGRVISIGTIQSTGKPVLFAPSPQILPPSERNKHGNVSM